MKTDYMNGIIDGVKCKKRGFVEDQELYEQSYNQGFAMICRATGLDTRTAEIVVFSGGFIATPEKIETVMFHAMECINNNGDISEVY